MKKKSEKSWKLKNPGIKVESNLTRQTSPQFSKLKCWKKNPREIEKSLKLKDRNIEKCEFEIDGKILKIEKLKNPGIKVTLKSQAPQKILDSKMTLILNFDFDFDFVYELYVIDS